MPMRASPKLRSCHFFLDCCKVWMFSDRPCRATDIHMGNFGIWIILVMVVVVGSFPLKTLPTGMWSELPASVDDLMASETKWINVRQILYPGNSVVRTNVMVQMESGSEEQRHHGTPPDTSNHVRRHRQRTNASSANREVHGRPPLSAPPWEPNTNRARMPPPQSPEISRSATSTHPGSRPEDGQQLAELDESSGRTTLRVREVDEVLSGTRSNKHHTDNTSDERDKFQTKISNGSDESSITSTPGLPGESPDTSTDELYGTQPMTMTSYPDNDNFSDIHSSLGLHHLKSKPNSEISSVGKEMEATASPSVEPDNSFNERNLSDPYIILKSKSGSSNVGQEIGAAANDSLGQDNTLKERPHLTTKSKDVNSSTLLDQDNTFEGNTSMDLDLKLKPKSDVFNTGEDFKTSTTPPNTSNKINSLDQHLISKPNSEIPEIGKTFEILFNMSTSHGNISKEDGNETDMSLTIRLNPKKFHKTDVSVVFTSDSGSKIYKVKINSHELIKSKTGKTMDLREPGNNIHTRNSRSDSKGYMLQDLNNETETKYDEKFPTEKLMNDNNLVNQNHFPGYETITMNSIKHNNENKNDGYMANNTEESKEHSAKEFEINPLNTPSADILLDPVTEHEKYLDVKSTTGDNASKNITIFIYLTSFNDNTPSAEGTVSDITVNNSSELNAKHYPKVEVPETANNKFNLSNASSETHKAMWWLKVNKTENQSKIMPENLIRKELTLNKSTNNNTELPVSNGAVFSKLTNNSLLSAVPTSVNVSLVDQETLKGDSSLETISLNKKHEENDIAHSLNHNHDLERKNLMLGPSHTEVEELLPPYDSTFNTSMLFQPKLEDNPLHEDFDEKLQWDPNSRFFKSHLTSTNPYEFENDSPDNAGILQYRFPDGTPYALEHSYDLDKYHRMLDSFLSSQAAERWKLKESIESEGNLDTIDKFAEIFTTSSISHEDEPFENYRHLKNSDHQFKINVADYDEKLRVKEKGNGDSLSSKDDYNYEDPITFDEELKTTLPETKSSEVMNKTTDVPIYSSKINQVVNDSEEMHRSNDLIVRNTTNEAQVRTKTTPHNKSNLHYLSQNNDSNDLNDTEYRSVYDNFHDTMHIVSDESSPESEKQNSHMRVHSTSSSEPESLIMYNKPSHLATVNPIHLQSITVKFITSDQYNVGKHPLKDVIRSNDKLHGDTFHVDLTESMLDPNGQIYKDYVHQAHSFSDVLNMELGDKSNTTKGVNGNSSEKLEGGSRDNNNGDDSLNGRNGGTTYDDDVNENKDVTEQEVGKSELQETEGILTPDQQGTNGDIEEKTGSFQDEASRYSDGRENQAGRLADENFTAQLNGLKTTASVGMSKGQSIDHRKDHRKGTEENTSDDDLIGFLQATRAGAKGVDQDDVHTFDSTENPVNTNVSHKATNDIVDPSLMHLLNANSSTNETPFNRVYENIGILNGSLWTNGSTNKSHDAHDISKDIVNQNLGGIDQLLTEPPRTTDVPEQEDMNDVEFMRSVIVPLEEDRHDYLTINVAKDRPMVSLVAKNKTVLNFLVGQGQMEVLKRRGDHPGSSDAIKSSILLPVKVNPQGPGYLNFSFVDDQPTVSVVFNRSEVDQFPVMHPELSRRRHEMKNTPEY